MRISYKFLLITTLITLAGCNNDSSSIPSEPIKTIEISDPEDIKNELNDGKIKSNETITFVLPKEELILNDNLEISGSLTLK